MNPDRISQLRHSGVDPVNDSPNNSASPSSSATFHLPAPTPPSSRLPLSLNPARLQSLCIPTSCNDLHDAKRKGETSPKQFSLIETVDHDSPRYASSHKKRNISSYFRKRWASGVGESEDREEKMFRCFVLAVHIQRVNAGGVCVCKRALCAVCVM